MAFAGKPDMALPPGDDVVAGGIHLAAAGASRIGTRLFPAMLSGMSIPPASQKVGPKSIRFTKSSTTRPARTRPGQRTAKATSQPMS